MSNPHPEHALAQFVATLSKAQVPAAVQARAEELFLDWVASALAGKGCAAVESIGRFTRAMGPGDGPSEILIDRRGSSPLMAAMANAAASHVVEQDDVHNGSVFHPGTVVFPVALAIAQERGSSGMDFLLAAVAGYEVGIRVGEFLGRSHYRIFHTTGTAGAVAAAVTAARLLQLPPPQVLHALGSAGTQASGLWEFLRDAADSKQLHTAHAAAAGLTSAYLAQDGFTGAQRILTGTQGLAAGTSTDRDVTRLTDGLGSRWALAETSFKFHASCRHTHPAADALDKLIRRHHLRPSDIDAVTAYVHQGAIDVLGAVRAPQTVHQAKFSMGTVLGLIAIHGRAGLAEFEQHYRDAAVAEFRGKVIMQLDPEVDAEYPRRWIGKVRVLTYDGRALDERVDVPKGDPGNGPSRQELEHKAFELAAHAGGATDAEMRRLCDFAWTLATVTKMPLLLRGT